MDLRPETDAAKQKDGKTIQILKVYLRIKRERVSGFQRDIKGFVSAFYISKTGIYRFFVNNGKLVDPLFYLIKETCIILHSFHGTCPRQDESIETKQASG